MNLRLLVCALLLSACGYTNEGDGTNTLFVEARVRYHAGNGRTSAEVRVEKNGQHVTNANVTLTDGDSDDVLTLVAGNGVNRYLYDQVSGFHRRLALRVEAGEDRLSAQLEGPGPHVIDAPLNNELLRRAEVGDELDVAWTVADGIKAQLLRIFVAGKEYQPSDDTGSYDRIPVADIAPGSHALHLERANRINLAGGTPRSTFEMIYDAANDFVLD